MSGNGGPAGVVVRVAEQDQAADGSFGVRVSFGDSAEYDVRVADPGDAGYEARLAWYFEEHLQYPFLDKDWEKAAVGQIAAYGQALFGQVFGGPAHYDYRMLRDRGFDGCRIEVSGSAELHQLHWEALRDPDLPAPLAVRVPVTRRVGRVGARFQLPGGQAAVHLLVVVARPDGPRDVGYRTVSRPLLDALRIAGLPVTVDLVRPGTWQALRDHLQEVSDERGSGWYQVVHFDLHGSFSDYAALEAGQEAGQLLVSPEVEPFEGRRGFVYFETAETGKAEPVPAEQVASLLAEHRVPVAVLNACQSAMQSGSEAGLAQRLAEAGVPVAVGMAYSVTVSAAERAMPVLYRRLASGADPVSAVHAARRELFEHRGRQVYFGQQLDLADWMLPVVFAQQPVAIALRPMTGPEQAEFYEREAAAGPEPATGYGFVGRDLDIQAVEHRLLAGTGSNELLVTGMAGAGKSTLLNHLAWWWQRTGLAGRVFRFSYEDRAWTSAQIVRQVRQVLLSPAEHAQADTMSEAAQAGQVAALLRARRHLLILDNFESVTATPAAIPHALSQVEQDKLKTLLASLRGGRTLVLLGSREPEKWVTAGGGGPGTYPLPGLDPQAASVLTDKILATHGAAGYLEDPAERDALQELVKLLGGYPLPLTVVLPVLGSLAPSAVLGELKAGGPGADPAGLIAKAIEYSHGKLDPALQSSLLLLAPFTAVIGTGAILEAYRDFLGQDEAVRALGEIDLAAALDRAVRVGLAAPHPQLGHLVAVQPVLPYFLRSRLHDQPALQEATAQAHYQLYTELGGALEAMLTSTGDPQERAAGQAAAAAEYANLTAALAHGLRTGQPITAIIAALVQYLVQSQQHASCAQLLGQVIASHPAPASTDQQAELAMLHDFAGHAALRLHRLDEARGHYDAELGLWEAAGDRERMGVTHHQLGRVAQEQRRFEEAEASYRQALEIDLEYGDRHGAAGTYGQLGNIALEQGRFEEAQASYRQALDIYLEYADRHGAAGTYHQLGRVAQEQGRLAEAQASYRRALDIYLEFGDRHRAAGTYHQLGMVAQEQGRLAEAQASYRRALDIFREYGDHRSASGTASQLGIACGRLGQHHEAARSLLYAAVTWHQETGQWDGRDLQWLHHERRFLDPAEFTALMEAEIPSGLAGELSTAIDAATDPEDQTAD